MSTAREEILSRVHTALSDQPADRAVPRDYRTSGDRDLASRCEVFLDRLRDYKAATQVTTPQDLSQAIADALTRRGITSLAVPAGLEASWLADVRDVQLHPDDPAVPLTAAHLDRCAGSITASAVAIAETGTIVLDASAGQGRRLLSLVPDYHLCVVFERDVVETVPEAVRQVTATRPQTWISGPSATSDIELQRVEGVHGPRTLEVILVMDSPGPPTSH